MTSRRGFLSAILAGAAAPAVVKAASLMKMVPTESGILTYDLNPDSLERMIINIREDIDLKPTQLIVPAYLANLALSMIHTKKVMSEEGLKLRFL